MRQRHTEFGCHNKTRRCVHGDECTTNNNSGADTTQECGAVDLDASPLLALGSQTPRFGTSATSQLSPISSQGAMTTQDVTLPGVDPSAPPRLDASGIGSGTEVGTDLLDDPGATTTVHSACVAGNVVPVPSQGVNLGFVCLEKGPFNSSLSFALHSFVLHPEETQ